jgi:hypothetical protein
MSTNLADFIIAHPEVALSFLEAIGEANMTPISGSPQADPITSIFTE